MKQFQQSLDKHLTTPSEDPYSEYAESVVNCLGDNFHFSNEDWIYKSTSFEKILFRLFVKGYEPKIAARIIEKVRNKNLQDNYDGPPDGEAWSGGFADNH